MSFIISKIYNCVYSVLKQNTAYNIYIHFMTHWLIDLRFNVLLDAINTKQVISEMLLQANLLTSTKETKPDTKIAINVK